MITREQDYQEVRRLLQYPKENRPKPDSVVSNLMKAERQMFNEATGQHQAWSVNTVSVTSVVDQAEYTVQPNDGATFGKALFAHRELDNSNILPVPLTDFLSEINNQKYQYWVAPVDSGESPLYNGEKLAFYRQLNAIKMRIYPIPEEARTYVITYAAGVLDWTTFQWSDVPNFPEFADYRQAMAAIMTIPGCEWPGYSMADNAAYRREIQQSLMMAVAQMQPEWRAFIRNPQQSPVIDEIGYWYQ
jgi:hypothetical protein